MTLRYVVIALHFCDVSMIAKRPVIAPAETTLLKQKFICVLHVVLPPVPM